MLITLSNKLKQYLMLIKIVLLTRFQNDGAILSISLTLYAVTYTYVH